MARDEAPSLILPGSQRSSQAALGGDVTAGAAGYQFDVGGSSSVGGIATIREGPDVDPRNVDLTQTDRTFFLKVGYAWRP